MHLNWRKGKAIVLPEDEIVIHLTVRYFLAIKINLSFRQTLILLAGFPLIDY